MEDRNRNIKNHFLFLLDTHDPKRAITLTSIVYKTTEEEVLNICKQEYDDRINHIKIID